MKGHESFKKGLKMPAWVSGHPSERYLVAMWVAQPAWADRKAILSIYNEARAKAVKLGPGAYSHVVDHIVPLRHPLVSGLHCEANLRVIRHHANQSKSNDWWPDMWWSQDDWVKHVPQQLRLLL